MTDETKTAPPSAPEGTGAQPPAAAKPAIPEVAELVDALREDWRLRPELRALERKIAALLCQARARRVRWFTVATRVLHALGRPAPSLAERKKLAAALRWRSHGCGRRPRPRAHRPRTVVVVERFGKRRRRRARRRRA